MASFGKLNEANVVLSVLKVDDKQLLDGDGVKQESLGQAFLENITGWPANQWIWDNGQGKYPMLMGSEWDPTNQIFWPRMPFANWTKNIAEKRWVSPTGDAPELTQEEKDQGKYYIWDEENQNYKLTQNPY
jgi:hypothetical protein|tara:strand:+ start:1724 stop:2116 length:393 start_codon:yes stop_codon:yes gene_type:complete